MVEGKTKEERGSQRGDQSGPELGNGKAVQEVAAQRLQAEAAQTAGTAGKGSSTELTIMLKDGATLRNVGRQIYFETLKRLPDEQELKAFVNDTARRNGLKTKDQQGSLEVGQVLKIVPPPPDRTTPGTHGAHKGGQLGDETKRDGKGSTGKTGQDTHVLAGGTKPTDKRHPLMKGGDSCEGEWANMVSQWVTQNEGSRDKHRAFNPNDMGQGISVGLLQWNQKKGKLPDLLHAWHDKNPEKFQTMFGDYSTNLTRDSFVRSADFVGNKTLHDGMVKALADREFQGVQDTLRNKNMVRACEVATDYGFKSLRGRAVVSDLFNQLGEGGARNVIRKVALDKPESARIEELKRRTGGRINGEDRVSTLEENVKKIWRQLGS